MVSDLPANSSAVPNQQSQGSAPDQLILASAKCKRTGQLELPNAKRARNEDTFKSPRLKSEHSDPEHLALSTRDAHHHILLCLVSYI